MCSLCAEETAEVYQLTEVQFTLVSGGSQKYVCGCNTTLPYSLCLECHDGYMSTYDGRHTLSDVSDRREKSGAYAKLLALAPDLLGRPVALHELGEVLWLRYFVDFVYSFIYTVSQKKHPRHFRQ